MTLRQRIEQLRDRQSALADEWEIAMRDSEEKNMADMVWDREQYERHYQFWKALDEALRETTE